MNWLPIIIIVFFIGAIAIEWIPSLNRLAVRIGSFIAGDDDEYICESCGKPADVMLLKDESLWCHPCNDGCRHLGYDDEDQYDDN